MGTLGNVALASAHGRCTAAALSCIQWKAHHKFHVPHDIEFLQKLKKSSIFLDAEWEFGSEILQQNIHTSLTVSDKANYLGYNLQCHRKCTMKSKTNDDNNVYVQRLLEASHAGKILKGNVLIIISAFSRQNMSKISIVIFFVWPKLCEKGIFLTIFH